MTANWLNQLRWFAIAAQTVTILIVMAAMSVHLPLASLAAVICVEVLFASICSIAANRQQLAAPRRLFICMLVDIGFLTALLYFSGGPENPFNFLYLVHVTLALVAVGEWAAWTLLFISSALFGGLFLFHVPLQVHGATGHGHDAHAMSLHMRGMWVGFVVASTFIVGFSSRLSRAVAVRERELEEARERARASERLASLATLAAGAAHELNTPLSTIALVARELEQATDSLDNGEELAEDARLIRTEIERCRAILNQLSLDAGTATGDQTSSLTVAEVLDATPHSSDARVVMNLEAPDTLVAAPLRSLTTALDALINNALVATTGPVTVTTTSTASELTFTVTDEGPGMDAETLARAREPFFTTHDDGSGMGLGLFLANTVADALGGTLHLDSSPDAGTTATFVIPASPS